MKVKGESEVAQLCPTLSDPTEGSPPGSSLHGIFQARVLEWGAIAFSIGSKYTSTHIPEFRKELLLNADPPHQKILRPQAEPLEILPYCLLKVLVAVT